MARENTTGRKGVSLAKGPVAILGLAGIVYGVLGLILKGHGFALHIPHGTVHGRSWIGLEVNGWSDLLFIAAGLLLLFAAPLHWGAKSMSLLVGLVLGGAAVIAVIRGDGVFGIFAANHLTELVWGAAAVVLLFLALLPRVGAKDPDPEPAGGRPVQSRDRALTPAQGSRTVRPRPRTDTPQVAQTRVVDDDLGADALPSAGARHTDTNQSH
jgi:hypothetical protein